MKRLILRLPISNAEHLEGYTSIMDAVGCCQMESYLFGSDFLSDSRIDLITHPYPQFFRDAKAIGCLKMKDTAPKTLVRFEDGSSKEFDQLELMRISWRYSDYKTDAQFLRKKDDAIWLSCGMVTPPKKGDVFIHTRNCLETLSMEVEDTVKALFGTGGVDVRVVEKPLINCGAMGKDPSVSLEFSRSFILSEDGVPDRNRIESFRSVMGRLYTALADRLLEKD